jgi:hypothetical protein
MVAILIICLNHACIFLPPPPHKSIMLSSSNFFYALSRARIEKQEETQVCGSHFIESNILYTQSLISAPSFIKNLNIDLINSRN